MREGARIRLLAAAVLLVVCGALALVALLESDSGGDEKGLKVDVFPGGPGDPAQVTVTLEDSGMNELETSGGRRSVRLDCVDRGGEPVIRARQPWPFSDTDQGALPPHVHQQLRPEVAGSVASCRLVGTSPPLRGDVTPVS